MKFFTHHVRLVSALLLALFLLANAGFTSVANTCTMSHKECSCCADDCDAATTLQDLQSGQRTILVAQPCHVVTVVGGLTIEPTTLEKTDLVHRITSAILLLPSLDNSVFIPHPLRIQFAISNDQAETASSVDKCVLNSTFLI